MSRTIKRRTAPRKTVGRPTVKRRATPKASRLNRLLAKLPVGEATLKKWATRGILGLAGVALLTGASYAGVPAMMGTALGEAAGRAGFRVTQVDIIGQKRMDSDTLRYWALDGLPKEPAIFTVDLEQVRQNILRYGWVADVRVSRRLPDVLLIDITERKPAAIWQNAGRLALIDAEGVLLDDRVDPQALPDLPLVIGPGADKQEAAYQRLLSAAPALKPRVVAATWVGNRRWDLRFDSGETLKLPEERAAAALLDFAKRDGANPLLGRGWLSFDLRNPDKMVVRKPKADNKEVADPGEPVSATPPSEGRTQGMEG